MPRMDRLILVQSVTSTIPFYYMQTLKLPEGTIIATEKLNRKFLWRDTDEKKMLHPISWKVVFSPKDEGGLGLRDLSFVNKALMVILGWRMIVEKDALWAKFLWAKYGNPLSETRAKQNISYIWRSVRHAMNLLKEGFQRMVNQPNSSP